MTDDGTPKISAALRARLAQLANGEMVTVIVLTELAVPSKASSVSRPAPRERRSRIAASKAATLAFRDTLVEEFAVTGDGRVVEQDLGMFGGVVVRATPQAIERLAARDDVTGIMYDQAVTFGELAQ